MQHAQPNATTTRDFRLHVDIHNMLVHVRHDSTQYLKEVLGRTTEGCLVINDNPGAFQEFRILGEKGNPRIR